MSVITTDWSSPQAEPVTSLIAACPEHLVGAILIPGAYGLKSPGKRYPEYWHWPVFQEGAPAAFLSLLQNGDYPAEAYGFHEQLWCGVWAPPDRPYDVTFLCAQLQHESLQQVVEAMIPTSARLYASPLVAHRQQRLNDIAAVRQFLRRYPHDELDFKRFPCANGTEVLEAIWGYRDAWDAALTAPSTGSEKDPIPVPHVIDTVSASGYTRLGDPIKYWLDEGGRGRRHATLLKVHHAMKADLKHPVGKTGEIVGEVSVAGLEKKYLVRFPGASQAANRFWIKARYLELQEADEGA